MSDDNGITSSRILEVQHDNGILREGLSPVGIGITSRFIELKRIGRLQEIYPQRDNAIATLSVVNDKRGIRLWRVNHQVISVIKRVREVILAYRHFRRIRRSLQDSHVETDDGITHIIPGERE